MPNYIVLRLTPSAAMSDADFTTLITTLTINVFDISYGNATGGTQIGSATFGAPALPGPFPVAYPLAGGSYPANTQLVQHFILDALGINAESFASVATAIIQYSPPAAGFPALGPEYPPPNGAPDLRIEFLKGGVVLSDPDLYYDVRLFSDPTVPFPPELLQLIDQSEVAGYIELPDGLNPNLSQVMIPSDGRAPAYGQLLNAVNQVLASDPGPGHPIHVEVAPPNGPLSVERCRNIAYEILWGSQPALPAPTKTLEDMYTSSQNSGNNNDPNEQARKEFEGNLASHYSVRNVQADRLAKYVYALSCAVWCEQQSQAATEGALRFPIDPGATPALATVSEAEIVLQAQPGQPLNFNVPAAYFYALGSMLPTQITAQRRYEMACTASSQANLTQFTEAVSTGVITTPTVSTTPAIATAVTPVSEAQAARMLAALGEASTTSESRCSLNAGLSALLTAWLSPAGNNFSAFWAAQAGTGAFLDLVLCALTEGYVIKNSVPAVLLADHIKANLQVHAPGGALLFGGVATVPQLIQALDSDWESFFATAPVPPGATQADLLPPFTNPGGVQAFILHLRKFFDILSPLPNIPLAGPGSPPTLDLPTNDLLVSCLAQYAALAGAALVFGNAMFNAGDLANLRTAAQAVAPGDEATQDWLFQTIVTLNELAFCVGTIGSAAFQFSLIEALYARGFTGIESILEHTQADFQQALIGTVAYNDAATIYTAALGGNAPIVPPSVPGEFHPINDGSLTDCIPPCFLSPLGPVAYLSEMLKVSESSTCDEPFAPPPVEHQTLGEVLAERRGPVATLEVTCANLDIQLPRIDLVNECLEFMASTNPPTPHGTVYNTSGDSLAGHRLCQGECCSCKDKDEKADCHDATKLFAALPEYSTPATPVAANAAVTPAVWDNLKEDFSSCCLPYSQALDVNRTYLRHFRTCRYETMRTFRKCITEFVLDPVNEPAGFQSHLWRYPVRVDIAIEYLGINPEEYETLFNGVWPGRCGPGEDHPRDGDRRGQVQLWELYGFSEREQNGKSYLEIVVKLPEFLKRTCLNYCQFLELWKSNFVAFTNGGSEDGEFPDCEPCCLEKVWLKFPEEGNAAEALYHLVIFIRLWRKLQELCTAQYSFAQLADICEVFELFIGALPNSEFVRRLSAFQILRDRFRLPLIDPEDQPPSNPTGPDRTHLLALWVGNAARKWSWALQRLIEGVEHYAVCRHHCPRRGPEFLKLLSENLDPLSLLGGFDPDTPGDTWHALPTHTLRFGEILAKIYASKFTVGEILYLFTADEHLNGDDPFPLQTENEGTELPLDLPDDECERSLFRLRQKLLDIHISEEQSREWTWKRIAAFLENELGFSAATLLNFGQHFFPEKLISENVPVAAPQRRYSTALLAANTPAAMWNSPPLRPFQYDPVAQELWTELPLVDEALFEQLIRIRHLNAQERAAVQDIYFQPRVSLAGLAFLFDDFIEADKHLIQESDESNRWAFFQTQMARAHSRCHIVAEHLSTHVAHVTHQPCPQGNEVVALLLRSLFAAENRALANWENDAGQLPPVTWTPPPNGGAYAALLGLTGTGLLREFTPAGRPLVWRDVSGPVSSFGHSRNSKNCPVPTILPALNLALTPAQQQFVSVLNGFGIKNSDGSWLGGAEGFQVKWTGALLIEKCGRYEFFAGSPAPGNEKPHLQEAECRCWRVILKRGQRTWVLLSHRWPDELCPSVACLELEPGAYEITIDFIQPSPKFTGDDDQICPQHTGFQLKYLGPDSNGALIEIPRRQLFCIQKNAPLGAGIDNFAGAPLTLLNQYYTSSFRDIRLTYQRAFKAVLFSHRFALSATPGDNKQSELGYMLANGDKFAGVSYYRNGPGFTQHKAEYDFNFLPLDDLYYPPPPAQDSRMQPSTKRKQAMFDWWERMFDYAQARSEVRAHCERDIWLLFSEAAGKLPANPGYLLRYICADARHWQLDLRYYQDQSSPVYLVSSADLSDDRWVVRAWHADRWLRDLLRSFRAKDITPARPDLWASLNPASTVNAEAETGNANLSKFLQDGCLESGQPKLYEELKRLNDGLRERGRCALLAYLCGPGGIVNRAKDLSDILLIDVEAGLCERSSRFEDTISSAQSFIQRARLGKEPGWTVTAAFVRLWDSRFSSFHVWEACKRRELYKENWVDWHDLEKAKKVEAFQFLEEELRRVTLTIAAPGGVDYWPDVRPPAHDAICLLQQRDPARMQRLNPSREGLNLLANPERAGRPTWLTTIPGSRQQQPPENPNRDVPEGALLALRGGLPALPTDLPFWMKAAMNLGRRFLRVAAGSYPPATASFHPRRPSDKPDTRDEKCVECCCECGCHHPPHVDEYYFWLVDARHYLPETQAVYQPEYDAQQQSYYDTNAQEATPWHDPQQLPDLLKWPKDPMVRLAWCRVHNGEFQEPRISTFGVQVPSGAAAMPDIQFKGRVGDSLYIQLVNATGPSPGFRYDIAPDVAKASEDMVFPAGAPASAPGGFWAYPYFAYVEPGARLFPWTLQTPAIAVANALRTHCRFEAALKWYQLVYDPLTHDNTWARCRPDQPENPQDPERDPEEPRPIVLDRVPELEERDRIGDDQPHDEPPENEGERTTCCDSTSVPCHIARNRSLLLQYLETLWQWSDWLMQRNSPEAFEQARVILDLAREILGKPPRKIRNMPPSPVQTVATFVPLFAPLNPRLISLYEHVTDRLGLVHQCLNLKRLKNSSPHCCLPYWGNDKDEGCCCDVDCCPESPYRFLFLVQKAQEIAGRVRELGAQLQSAFANGDAERLAFIRAQHERELLVLSRRIRKDQWRDADWQIQALGKTKESAQATRRYYAQLIQNGLNNNENQYEALIQASMSTKGASIPIEAIAEVMDIIPDLFIGYTNTQTWIPLGTKLAGLFRTIARIVNTVAEIENTNAGLHLTEGGWDRRLQEWVHQVEITDIQIEQVELQILGAERRRDQALRELNNQQRQIENSSEILDFLRDKLTNHAVYLFLQKEIAALHYKMYELALCTAKQAERAFNFERGHTRRRFMPCESWDNLHEGFLAGERLQLALAQMEKEYLDLNVREYELTKHISLRLHSPFEFLRLKLTGKCEIQFPEWLFDLDYPGQYMRRIKNVTVTLPCVAGPYTGVHCRLTLLCSQTRIHPALSPPASHCCSDEHTGNSYEACCNDPRMACEYGAKEAIATSSGQNDAGLFELNFRDERYLPFEFQGAISRWRVELPPCNNFFDIETLSDVVIHLNYTAREGGEMLRHAAHELAQKHLPGSGWRLFDIRHDFPDAWELFRTPQHDKMTRSKLRLRLSPKLFPFLPCHRHICVDKIALVFETACPPTPECPISPCPCPEERPIACHKVKLTGDIEKLDCGCDVQIISCLATEDCKILYHGVIDAKVGPLENHRHGGEVCFEFPIDPCDITTAFLFCHYTAAEECRCVDRPTRHQNCRCEEAKELAGV